MLLLIKYHVPIFALQKFLRIYINSRNLLEYLPVIWHHQSSDNTEKKKWSWENLHDCWDWYSRFDLWFLSAEFYSLGLVLRCIWCICRWFLCMWRIFWLNHRLRRNLYSKNSELFIIIGWGSPKLFLREFQIQCLYYLLNTDHYWPHYFKDNFLVFLWVGPVHCSSDSLFTWFWLYHWYYGLCMCL